MSKRVVHEKAFRILLAAFLLLVATAATAAEPHAPDATDSSERVFAVYYLPFFDAKLLVEERLGSEAAARRLGRFEIGAEPPRSSAPGSPSGFLRVSGDRQIQALVEEALKTLDRPVSDRLFQVILLEASKQPSAEPSDLPSGAARAVRDLQELMPFRGFRTLQSGLVRASREGHLSLGGEFTLDFEFRAQHDVRKPVLFEKFGLHRQVPLKSEPGKTEFRSVLQTSFTIGPGETVVVGTSRLDGGDQALVVLVTAVP